jgi:hypothetical protein
MTAYAWLHRIVMDRLIEVWRHENRDCRDPDREMHWPERSSIGTREGFFSWRRL